jgi:hypothetical protein
LGERPRDDGEIELLNARTRSIIDLVLYFEDLLEGNDDSGLTVEEKLHRLSYKLQWGEEKYEEMWGALGAILVALRGDQGKVTTSSCDTEDDGSGPRSSSCAYHSQWVLGGWLLTSGRGKVLRGDQGLSSSSIRTHPGVE